MRLELHAKQSADSEISIRHTKAGSFQNGGAKFWNIRGINLEKKTHLGDAPEQFNLGNLSNNHDDDDDYDDDDNDNNNDDDNNNNNNYYYYYYSSMSYKYFARANCL